MAGFELSRFPRPPHEETLCVCCRKVVNDPKQAPCEHLICSGCLPPKPHDDNKDKQNDSSSSSDSDSDSEHAGRNDTRDMECPVCRTRFLVSAVKPPSRFVRNVLNSLRIRCRFCQTESENDLGKMLTVGTVAEHESQKCLLAPVNCPNKGCGASMHRHSLLEHTEKECPFRKVLCPNKGCLCAAPGFTTHSNVRSLDGKRKTPEDASNTNGTPTLQQQQQQQQRQPTLLAKDLQLHRETTCTHEPMACPLGCHGNTNDGSNHAAATATTQGTDPTAQKLGESSTTHEKPTLIPRWFVCQHVEQECPALEIACIVTGCEFRAQRGDTRAWTAHMIERAEDHMQTVVQRVNNMGRELGAGKREIVVHETRLAQQLKRAELVKSATWSVEGVRKMWKQGSDTTSHEIVFDNPNPRLRYTFKLNVRANCSGDDGFVCLYFIPCRGNNDVSWPISRHIRLSFLSVTGGEPRSVRLCSNSDREWFQRFAPPPSNNSHGRGSNLLSEKELDGNDFIDDDDKMYVLAELLDTPFSSSSEESDLIRLANNKGADWVLLRVRERWPEGIEEVTPTLTFSHPNPALCYRYALLVNTTPNGSHIGLFFILKPKPSDNTELEWPIANQIRLSILNVKNGPNKTFILCGALMREWLQEQAARCDANSTESVQGRGLVEMLSKDQATRDDYIDSEGRMFIKAELMPEKFLTPSEDQERTTFAHSKGASWYVQGVRARWKEGFEEFSPPLSMTHEDPKLCYSFTLGVTVREGDNFLSVSLTLRDDKSKPFVQWPFSNHVRLIVLSVNGGEPRARTVLGALARQCLTSETPPTNDGRCGCQLVKMLSKGEVMDCDHFVDDQDRLFIKLELLEAKFATTEQEMELIKLANTKIANWVFCDIPRLWEEGVCDDSPHLTILHAEPALQYTYSLRLLMNLTNFNRGFLGLFFAPVHEGSHAHRVRWPMMHRVRLTVLNISGMQQQHQWAPDRCGDKVLTICGDGALEALRDTTPPGEDNDKRGSLFLMSKAELFSGRYLDAQGRLFVRVELLGEKLP